MCLSVDFKNEHWLSSYSGADVVPVMWAALKLNWPITVQYSFAKGNCIHLKSAGTPFSSSHSRPRHWLWWMRWMSQSTLALHLIQSRHEQKTTTKGWISAEAATTTSAVAAATTTTTTTTATTTTEGAAVFSQPRKATTVSFRDFFHSNKINLLNWFMGISCPWTGWKTS